MPPAPKSDVFVKPLLGLISASIIALFGWVWSAQNQLTRLNMTVEALATDNQETLRQSNQLVKHWKLHSWERDRITELRNLHDLPLSPWPDLGP